MFGICCTCLKKEDPCFLKSFSFQLFSGSFVPILLWCFVQTFVIFVKNFQRKYFTKGKCRWNAGWHKKSCFKQIENNLKDWILFQQTLTIEDLKNYRKLSEKVFLAPPGALIAITGERSSRHHWHFLLFHSDFCQPGTSVTKGSHRRTNQMNSANHTSFTIQSLANINQDTPEVQQNWNVKPSPN